VRVAVTGAAGTIGSVLVPGLRERGHEVRGLDRRSGAGVDVVGDCLDPSAVDRLLEGTDAVVHLAGNPGETDLPTALDSHVLTTAAVCEGMLRHHVGRLVLASSNHAVGRTPRSDLVDDTVPPRPDTFYGVAKVAAEAVSRLYADRHGLQVACLRIGSFADRPHSRHQLATWLSHGDAVRLVDACLTAPGLGFAVLYGISGNTRAWWDLAPARRLGYAPADDAETWAEEILATAPSDDELAGAGFLGGSFATPAYIRPAFDQE
jgi:uronate dehydrogenase